MSKESKRVSTVINWLDDVAPHDYESAHDFLSLLLDDSRAKVLTAGLQAARIGTRRVNDILRASGVPALGMSDPGVIKDAAKVMTGYKLSPVLIASFAHGCVIADGYHRISLTYNLNPFADVPCRIAHLPDLHT